MSATTTTFPAPAVPAPGALASAGRLPLLVGLAGIAVSGVGFAVATKAMAFSWLLGMVFWTSIALGMLFFIMIQHVFDAGWGVVVRRQAEHGVAAFPYLAVLFLPLLAVTFLYKPDILWKWLNPDNVTWDVVYAKKSGFLNGPFFVVRTVLYFGVWCVVAAALRRNSFAQDRDADVKYTHRNRFWAATGLIAVAVTSTFASIDWIKALDYHWFSTMYGVWFFAASMRVALSVLVLACLVLAARGYYAGILQKAHLHDLGKLMFAFTVFYAYVTFSQYFIIWNANIPEVTYWYNIREFDPATGAWNSWWWVGMAIIFGHFLFPFLFLIQYKTKVTPKLIGFAAVWILGFQLLDFYYNILPSKKVADAAGHALSYTTGQATLNPFEMTPVAMAVTPWDIAALVGIGGICVWAYLRSFAREKLIPVHDPRILESVHHHE